MSTNFILESGLFERKNRRRAKVLIISEVITHRIDDMPLLVALLQHLTLAAILDDEAVPTHGNTMNHHELTNGEAICIWLVYLVSQADHRKMTVEEWVGHNSAVLSKLWGAPVPASNFTDDRLSTLLTRLTLALLVESILTCWLEVQWYDYQLTHVGEFHTGAGVAPDYIYWFIFLYYMPHPCRNAAAR